MTFTLSRACCSFFFNDPATTEIYTLSLHDALPISSATESDRILRAQLSHALGAHQKNRIPREQPFVFIHVAGEAVSKFLHLFEEPQRRLKRQPADSEIRRHHPLAPYHPPRI